MNRQLCIWVVAILCTSAQAIALVHSDLHTRAVNASSKAGLAWPNGDYNDIKQFGSTGKVSWYYTWNPAPVDSSLEFVPMLWGEKQVVEFKTTINHTIATHGVTSVLGMNEPQEVEQANMTAEDGAAMWISYLEPLRAQGVRLGSPATSSSPTGKYWVLDFLTACAGRCTVDFITLHWYDINATAFINYVEDFHNTFQRPIWVTEWACQNMNNATDQCSPTEIAAFLNVTQAYLDTTPWVERYAWFGAMEYLNGVNQNDALMSKHGKINNLGLQYIGSNATSSARQTRTTPCHSTVTWLLAVFVSLAALASSGVPLAAPLY